MNVRLLQMAGLSLAGLIALSGCTGDDDGEDDLPPKDTGVDSGVTGDTGVDTGVPDTGADSGTPDTGPNTMGTEGFACNSTLTPQDTMFKQDNCNTDLLCVPWDLVAGRQDDVTAPVHSCVRPCTNDTDCGAGRFCANTSLGANSGAARMCVDQLSGVDEFCHLSKLSTSRLAMVTVELPGVMAGCADGVLCSPGGAANAEGDQAIAFTDVHPDNGICMTLCADQADCAGRTGLNYCNPRYSQQTSTVTVGVCSYGRIDQIGAFCGNIPPANPDGIGLSNGCDAAAGLDCLGVGGLFPTGAGFCGQFCANNQPCTATEPGGEAYTCSAAPGNNPMGEGLCTWDGSDNFPDSCDGDGSMDFGRQPLFLVYGGDPNNPNDDVPLPLCVDRTGPPLSHTIVTPDALAIATEGDDCTVTAATPFAWSQCLEGAYCDEVAANVFKCLVGCTRTTTTAAGPQGGCQIVSNTSSCAPYYVDAMMNPVEFGVCGDNP